MDEIFLYFGIVFGTRYTLKSKKLFLAMLDHRMKLAGYKNPAYNKEYDATKRQAPQYVVYGSLKQAKTIFVAPFDTCAKSFIPHYEYRPLNEAENTRCDRINGIIELLLVLLCTGLCGLLVWLAGFDISFTSVRTLFTLLPMLVFGILIYKITQGIPNSPNFNRNSAALTLMYALANDSVNKKNAAFVFCNDACASPEGLVRFYQDCPQSCRHKIVLLDCLAWGSELVLAHKAGRREKEVEDLRSCKGGAGLLNVSLGTEATERSVLALLDDSLLLFSGEREGDDFIVKNTRSKKDGKLNTERLESLRDLFLEYLACN